MVDKLFQSKQVLTMSDKELDELFQEVKPYVHTEAVYPHLIED